MYKLLKIMAALSKKYFPVSEDNYWKKKINMVKYQTIVHSPALIIKINFAQGFLVFDGVVLNHCSYKSKITNSIIQKVDQLMAHSFCSVKKGSSVKRRARLIAATLVAYGYTVCYNYYTFRQYNSDTAIYIIWDCS